jgi:hypothetical protein
LSLFVDTSVWSLALRRDVAERGAEVAQLAASLVAGQPIFTTGLRLMPTVWRGPR